MPTPRATPKTMILEAVESLPDDSSYEAILRELAFLRMVQRGLADAEAGRTLDNREMAQRIASWSKATRS